jgi:hypothetical protein
VAVENSPVPSYRLKATKCFPARIFCSALVNLGAQRYRTRFRSDFFWTQTAAGVVRPGTSALLCGLFGAKSKYECFQFSFYSST